MLHRMLHRMPLEIIHVDTFEQARALRDQGYEPVECSFGTHGSVLGPLELDHHGSLSHRDGVALQAWRDHFGTRTADPRFVVTGSPDADAVLAIIALAALVERDRIPARLVGLVDRRDRDPIGLDLLAEPGGETLLLFEQQEQRATAQGYFSAVRQMIQLLEQEPDEQALRAARASDLHRRGQAERGLLELLARGGASLPLPTPADAGCGGGPLAPAALLRRGERACCGPERVALVQSPLWGFDVWYHMAPVVVSYNCRLRKITVGCPDRATAELLFGPRGLAAVFPLLGPGWGGRESVGGSPRGEPLVLADARRTARRLAELVVR